MMSDQEYLELRSKIQKACWYRGMMNEREDIAHEIILRILEGFHKKATIDQMIVDYMRRKFGRPIYKSANKKYLLEMAIMFGERKKYER